MLKFLSLDIVPFMVMKYPVTSWEKDESYSLGVWPRPKSLGSFCGMEEVRFVVVVVVVVVVLFCFSNSTK